MAGTLSRLALEEILVARGLVSRSDLDALPVDASGRPWLADRVVAAGLLTEEQIAFAVSEDLGYPLVTPSADSVDADLVRRVPADVLRRHRALPVLAREDGIDVAFADPTDSRAVAAVSKAIPGRLLPAVATSSAIRAALRQVHGPESDRATEDDDVHEASGALRLHSFLVGAAAAGADAIQVRPLPGGAALRRRLRGRWEDVERVSPGARAALLARLASLVGLPAADRREAEGVARRAALVTRLSGRDLRLTASFVPTADGECATLAIHDARPIDPESPEAALSPRDVERLAAWAKHGDGLLAVNDADEDAALSFVARLLAHRAPGDSVAVAARAGTPRVEGALHVAAAAGATLDAAAEAAAACLPDVLVLVPGPGAPPPRAAFLGAQGGRRVVLVGAWRDADEARAAWAEVGLPAGTVDRATRWVVTFARGDGAAERRGVLEDGRAAS
jgi:hypothetical protein